MREISSKINNSEYLFAAQVYLSVGYSVIPVWGDTRPSHSKTAAVAWKDYQNRQPSPDELEEWFADEQFGGLAIVTGSVSRLAVLDFDDASLAEHFQRAFPELTATYTVYSAGRGLPHFYFRLPTGYELSSSRISGADLQAEGRYIIAPPTSIDGRPYRIGRGGVPINLSTEQIEAVLRFLGGASTQQEACIPISTDTKEESYPGRRLREEDAVAIYRHFALKNGRNEALFKVGLLARDSGWTQAQAQQVLIGIHALQPTAAPHYKESDSQRRKEAAKTIASAYSRPPRKQPAQPVQLPNSVREAFSKMGLICVVRLLDGLLLKGFKPGDAVTERQICLALHGIVGRHSILKALRAKFASGQPVFSPVHPSPRTSSPTNVATEPSSEKIKKCFLIRATKPNKIPRGRQSTRYILPEVRDLCSQLGVKYTPSAPIEAKDLLSARKTRQALHRESIRAMPGQRLRSVLAGRIGISVRTCQRYNKQIPICVIPMFEETPISWHNLTAIPADEPLAGTFLRDDTGKRYPPKVEIARKLLSRKRKVTFVRQQSNYYWYGDWRKDDFEEIVLSKPRPTTAPSISNPHQEAQNRVISAQKPPQKPISEAKIEQGSFWPAEPPTPIRSKKAPPKRSPRYYRRPLPDDQLERLANRIHQWTVLRCSPDTAGKISLPNARRLVELYEMRLLEYALLVLGRRKNIRNPAGFLRVFLRSTARFDERFRS